MTWPSAAVMVSSGPTGAAPCETHGSTSTPSRRAPTAPSSHRRSPRNSAALPSSVRALARPPRTGTPGARRGQLAQHDVGRERVGVGEQDDGGRVVELGQPADRDRVRLLAHVEVEGLGAAVAERGGPHRHRGAALDLATVADDAAGAAADQHRRRERLVHALERRLGRGQVRSGGEDADHVGARAVERQRGPADPPRSPPGAGRSRSTARSRCARSRAGRYSCPWPLPRLPCWRSSGRPASARRRWPSPSPSGCAPRRAAGRGVGRRAAGLPGPRDAHRRAAARRARAPGPPPGLDPARRRALLGRRVRRAGTRGDRRAARAARRPDRGRRHRAVPARGAGAARPAPRGARRGARALGGRARPPRARSAARRARAPRAVGRRVRRPARPQPDRAPARARRAGRARAADGAQPALDLRHAPSDASGRPRHGPRCALRAHRRPRRRHGGRGRRTRGARRPRRRGLGDGPQGSGLRRAAGRRRRGDEAPHPQPRAPPAHLDAQAGGRRGDRRHGPRPGGDGRRCCSPTRTDALSIPSVRR